jgi:toluene monooxygenase system ferredoxin subunit
MALQPVLDADDLWDGEMTSATVAGRRLVLLRIDGEVRAYDDRCPHQGVPLSEGTLCEGKLVCRAHLHEYDARSGAGLNPRNVCLAAVPACQRDGKIYVEVAP